MEKRKEIWLKNKEIIESCSKAELKVVEGTASYAFMLLDVSKLGELDLEKDFGILGVKGSELVQNKEHELNGYVRITPTCDYEKLKELLN